MKIARIAVLAAGLLAVPALAQNAAQGAPGAVAPSDPHTMQGGAQTGATTDASIVSQVNAELTRDPQLQGLGIQVEAVQGKVSLKGSAPSEAAKDRAEQVATSVQGVSSVDNQLKVGS